MSNINVLAVSETGPITTKTALRSLVKINPSGVKVIPAHATPVLASATAVDNLYFGLPVTVHVGKTTAEIERKFDGKIVIR